MNRGKEKPPYYIINTMAFKRGFKRMVFVNLHEISFGRSLPAFYSEDIQKGA